MRRFAGRVAQRRRPESNRRTPPTRAWSRIRRRARLALRTLHESHHRADCDRPARHPGAGRASRRLSRSSHLWTGAHIAAFPDSGQCSGSMEPPDPPDDAPDRRLLPLAVPGASSPETQRGRATESGRRPRRGLTGRYFFLEPPGLPVERFGAVEHQLGEEPEEPKPRAEIARALARDSKDGSVGRVLKRLGELGLAIRTDSGWTAASPEACPRRARPAGAPP